MAKAIKIVKKHSRRRPKGLYLTLAEIKAVLAEIDNERWQLAVLTGFWHGLRVSEIIHIQGRDLRQGHLKVDRLKGSLATDQAFVASPDPELDEAERLRDLHKLLAPDDLCFPISRDGFAKMFARAAARAGIDERRRNPHILKHSIAHYMIEVLKHDINLVQGWLGHASLGSTGAYLKLTGEQINTRFAAALSGLHAMDQAA